MTQYLIGAIVTLLGIVGTYLGIRVTVRGTSKSKEVDAAIEAEKTKAADRKDYTAGAVASLENSWDENRDLRKELSDARQETTHVAANMRKEIDEVWARLTEVREKANLEIESVRRKAEEEVVALRRSFREEKEADEAYIAQLLDHINERRDPPAPVRKKVQA